MNEQRVKLPDPAAAAGMDLMAALRLRRSTREYDPSREVPPTVLSTLLWAADGVSAADDKRTAPSAFGGNQVLIYVAAASAAAKYDAPAHALDVMVREDIRSGLCPDEWVATAPISIILTGRRDKFPDFVSPEMALELLQATAGCIAENLHLIASALGLGTCMVGHMNGDAVRSALRLTAEEIPLYVMPVGYPRV